MNVTTTSTTNNIILPKSPTIRLQQAEFAARGSH